MKKDKYVNQLKEQAEFREHAASNVPDCNGRVWGMVSGEVRDFRPTDLLKEAAVLRDQIKDLES